MIIDCHYHLERNLLPDDELLKKMVYLIIHLSKEGLKDYFLTLIFKKNSLEKTF